MTTQDSPLGQDNTEQDAPQVVDERKLIMIGYIREHGERDGRRAASAALVQILRTTKPDLPGEFAEAYGEGAMSGFTEAFWREWDRLQKESDDWFTLAYLGEAP